MFKLNINDTFSKYRNVKINKINPLKINFDRRFILIYFILPNKNTNIDIIYRCTTIK